MRRSIAFVVVSLACGPLEQPAFRCTLDVQCTSPDGEGQCTDEGFCAFADESCPSGLRYGALASDEFAEICVDP